MYRDCYHDTSSYPLLGESIVHGEVKKYRKTYTSKDYTPWLYDKTRVGKLRGSLPPCVYGVPIIDYLNN
jgi:hypothetical protein